MARRIVFEEEKTFAPIFQCKNCGEKFVDNFQSFTAGEHDISSIRMILNTRCKGNAPMHRCSDLSHGLRELVGVKQII